MSRPEERAQDVQGHIEPEGAESTTYLIAHIDIRPDRRPVGEALLVELVRRARRDAVVDNIELLREQVLDNHYVLVCRFPDRASYDRFVEEPYVRELRGELYSMLGSPWDDRLTHRVGAPQ